MQKKRRKQRGVERRQLAKTAPPTISQIQLIGELNEAMSTFYAVPKSELGARFLIDGMVVEERRMRHGR